MNLMDSPPGVAPGTRPRGSDAEGPVPQLRLQRKTFRNAFYERIDEARQTIEDLLPASARVTGNTRKMITATYDIEVDRHTDIFEAYIAALETALVDLVWNNERLTEQLTELYDSAVDEVYKHMADTRD